MRYELTLSDNNYFVIHQGLNITSVPEVQLIFVSNSYYSPLKP